MVDEVSSNDAANHTVDALKPARSRRFRFGINSVLMITTLIATFVACEVNRQRNRKFLEHAALEHPRFHANPPVAIGTRFESLDAESQFVAGLTKWIGPEWNEVVTAMVLFEDTATNEVLNAVVRLRHLRVLAITDAKLSTGQIESLGKLKSLQWLYFVNMNVDQAVLNRLRKTLPNAFVHEVEYD